MSTAGTTEARWVGRTPWSANDPLVAPLIVCERVLPLPGCGKRPKIAGRRGGLRIPPAYFRELTGRRPRGSGLQRSFFGSQLEQQPVQGDWRGPGGPPHL